MLTLVTQDNSILGLQMPNSHRARKLFGGRQRTTFLGLDIYMHRPSCLYMGLQESGKWLNLKNANELPYASGKIPN